MDKTAITNRALLNDALAGLLASAKRMNPKWFYDQAGSALFEDITALPEYYPTRTEAAILTAQADQLATHVPKGAALVELGSGASVKTRILLDKMPNLGGYIPVDVSALFLSETADRLSADYPDLLVHPVVGDFFAKLELPAALAALPKVGFFPGSTIGNLEREDAVHLLSNVRAWEGISAFILGVDLVKDPSVLVRAYDDAAGVTAAFNLNLLTRLNRECGAAFNLSHFAHEARWNADLSRIEMHLVSLIDQQVYLGSADISFAKGESIHTESSHKYTLDAINELAKQSGWRVDEIMTDAQDLFAVVVLQPS